MIESSASASTPNSCDQLLDTWRKHIILGLDQGLACWDRNNRLVFTNPQFLDIAGKEATALVPGSPIGAWVRASAFSGEFVIGGSIEAWISSVLHDLQSFRAREHRLADGRWISVTPLRAPDGTIVRLQDITLQKNGELALLHAKELAETSNFTKSRFLRAANHDLRQPLATLKILIYSAFEEADEKRKKELLHTMDVTVSIMEELLGALLQIGQLDAGRIAKRVVHFQLSHVMRRLQIEFAPQAAEKGLRLRVVPSHVTVETDRALLERILSNFLANAIRFTDTGTVLFGARRRGGYFSVEVWDTGCGIPDDQQKLIFEEFHQVYSSAAQGRRGLGLGLNIASRLAELLGHTVHVCSRSGKGSKFSILIPLGDVWRSEVGEPEIDERIGGEFRDITILVVEDNLPFRESLCELLKRWGVQVHEAGDAARAVGLVEDGLVPDLLISDYRLPNGKSGLEILHSLRERVGAGLPAIVATADTDPSLIEAMRGSGIPVLIKPINPARLRSAMHHLLYERPRDSNASDSNG